MGWHAGAEPQVTRARTSPWGWALAGVLLGLVLTTLVNAPARWFTPALQQATQGRILLQNVRGTVWNGSAQLVLAGGAGSTDAVTLPGRLAWLIRPDGAGLQADLLADCCMQQAWRLRLLPRWGGARLVVTDSRSQWSAQWLSGLGTPWNTVQPDGQLTLSTQGLAVAWVSGRLVVDGRAGLEAVQISSRMSTLRPMGSYRLTLYGGAAPRFTLETIEGSLQMSGTGQWVGARLHFEGEASAAPERLDALSNLLNILGRRDGVRSLIKVG